MKTNHPVVKENMSSRLPNKSCIRSEPISNLKLKYVRFNQEIPNRIDEENLHDSPTQTKIDISSQLNVIIS